MPRVPQLLSSKARTHTQPGTRICVLIPWQTGHAGYKVAFPTWAPIGRSGKNGYHRLGRSTFSLFFPPNLMLV